VKIDNLVQVAHNVVIGENSAIAAQTGISGSTKIGKSVMIGGKVGIVRPYLHRRLRHDRRFLRCPQEHSGPAGWRGTPFLPYKDFLKVESCKVKLPGMRRKITTTDQTSGPA